MNDEKRMNACFRYLYRTFDRIVIKHTVTFEKAISLNIRTFRILPYIVNSR